MVRWVCDPFGKIVLHGVDFGIESPEGRCTVEYSGTATAWIAARKWLGGAQQDTADGVSIDRMGTTDPAGD
tara:strand:+ start:484 stop:696 length:213 start_codon:yes stop_codon:yes gene_type:complete